jgi:hypothetical protein
MDFTVDNSLTRLYNAVLELTLIPSSQLDMMLLSPSDVDLSKRLLQFILEQEARKIGAFLESVETGMGIPRPPSREIDDHAVGK